MVLLRHLKKTLPLFGALGGFAGFVSDVLQPIAPFSSYGFLVSIFAAALLSIIMYFKSNIREILIPYLILSISTILFTGSLLGLQTEENNQKGVLASTIPIIGDFQGSLGIIQKDIEIIKEATQAIRETSLQTAKNTKNIVESLNQIQEGFSNLTQLGGIIANPERPEQLYHNARVYELSGDYGNARRSYNRYFTFKLDLLDPHIRYQRFLKIQEGRAGALEIYSDMYDTDNRMIVEFARILLFEAKTRIQLLEAFKNKYPDFAPVYYEISREYSPSRKGIQQPNDKKFELRYIKVFLKLANAGNLLKYFIDNEEASKWLEYSNNRLNLLNSELNEVKISYYDDGSIKLRTNYENGIKNGLEEFYANNNDKIILYDGYVTSDNISSLEKRINSFEWSKTKQTLLEKNYYENGTLKNKDIINYYIDGQIYKITRYKNIKQDDSLILNVEKEIQSLEFERDYLIENSSEGDWDIKRYNERYNPQINKLKFKLNFLPYGYTETFYKHGNLYERILFSNVGPTEYSKFYNDGAIFIKSKLENRQGPNRQQILTLHGPTEIYHRNGTLMLNTLLSYGYMKEGKILNDKGNLWIEKIEPYTYSIYNNSGDIIEQRRIEDDKICLEKIDTYIKRAEQYKRTTEEYINDIKDKPRYKFGGNALKIEARKYQIARDNIRSLGTYSSFDPYSGKKIVQPNICVSIKINYKEKYKKSTEEYLNMLMVDPLYKGIPESNLKFTAQAYERKKIKALSSENNNNGWSLDVIKSGSTGSDDLECLFKDPYYCIYKPKWSLR